MRTLTIIPLVCLTAALAAACTQPVDAGFPVAVHEVEVELELNHTNTPWEGQPIEVGFVARDAAGAAVQGAGLAFSFGAGEGDIDPVRGTTGADGRIVVTVTPAEPGPVEIIAQVENSTVRGTAFFNAVRVPVVSFQEKEVTLEQIGDKETLFARVMYDDEIVAGSDVDYVAEPTGVVSLHAILGATGTYRGMVREARAEAPGTALVIATHPSGAADTARVTVPD